MDEIKNKMDMKYNLFVLVYAISNVKSFEFICLARDQIQRILNPPPLFICVGMKGKTNQSFIS